MLARSAFSSSPHPTRSISSPISLQGPDLAPWHPPEIKLHTRSVWSSLRPSCTSEVVKEGGKYKVYSDLLALCLYCKQGLALFRMAFLQRAHADSRLWLARTAPSLPLQPTSDLFPPSSPSAELHSSQAYIYLLLKVKSIFSIRLSIKLW